MKLMRYGVAAALAIAAGIALVLTQGGFNSQTAFADMMEQVRDVQMLSFTLTVEREGEDEPVFMQVYAMNPGRYRLEADTMGIVQIMDMQEGRMVTLVGGQNKAIIMTLEGMPESVMNQDIVAQFSQLDEDHSQYTGEEDLDGINTHHYTFEQGPMIGELWMNAATNLPVKIEMTSMIDEASQTFITMDNFNWSVDLDPALFSMEIPEGYERLELDVVAGEDSFVYVLKIWGTLSNEPFPADFGSGHLAYLNAMLLQPPDSENTTQEEIEAWVVEKLTSVLGEDGLDEDGNLREEALMEFSTEIAGGAMFFATLGQEYADTWRWVGGGVSAGDAQSPLCWWQPEDSDTYRVVYGDFSIRDVAPEDLPDIPEPEPESEPQLQP